MTDKTDIDCITRHCSKGNTALTRASRLGHENVVKALLSRDDLDVNTANKEGLTALMCAVEGAHYGIIRLLLMERRDIDVRRKNIDEQTALMLAVEWKRTEAVKILTELSVDNLI